MSEHAITLHWSRATDSSDYETYNRAHEITFKNGQTVTFSAAVAYRGDAGCVDPEEAFVASLASCHMLTFLAIASKRGFRVDSYRDQAVGYLDKNKNGKLAMTRVELRPEITFNAAGTKPDDTAMREMHAKAHENCFIANSVRTAITVTPA